MFAGGLTWCQISTPVPIVTSPEEVISLLHNHTRHMELDAHLDSKTLLDRQTLPLMPRRKPTSPDDTSRDLSDWLFNETRRYVANVNIGPRSSRASSEWDVEFWSVEISHPMGKMFGKLRYSAAFINTVDGVAIIVEVPGGFGMRSWTRYSVKPAVMGQGYELTEDIKLQCPYGFGGFTKKEIEKSHPEAHRKIMDDLNRVRY